MCWWGSLCAPIQQWTHLIQRAYQNLSFDHSTSTISTHCFDISVLNILSFKVFLSTFDFRRFTFLLFFILSNDVVHQTSIKSDYTIPYFTLYLSSTNKTYPIYVVLLHEVGHVLKLKHLPQPHTIMFRFFNHLNNKLTDIDIESAQRVWGKRRKSQTVKSTKSRNNSYRTTTSTIITKQQHKNLTATIIILSIIVIIIISVFILLLLLFCRYEAYSRVLLQEHNSNL